MDEETHRWYLSLLLPGFLIPPSQHIYGILAFCFIDVTIHRATQHFMGCQRDWELDITVGVLAPLLDE